MENGQALVQGYDAGYLLDSRSRIKIDLSGVWNYAVRSGPSGQVKLPGSQDFVGEVTFERGFELPSNVLDSLTFYLVMFGSNYITSVSINGDFVVNHVGGYTSFVQPVLSSSFIPGQTNTIQVVTANELNARRTLPLPSQTWGWRNYGGIVRDVFILGIPKTNIADVQLVPEFSANYASARLVATATIDGKISDDVENDPKPPTLGFYFELHEKISGAIVGRSPAVSVEWRENGWSQPRAEIVVTQPNLWSPSTPDLYFVKSYLTRTVGKNVAILDEHILNYGFRNIELDNGNFLLNGKRLRLRGVIWNEYHPTWGGSLPHEIMEKDVILIKNLGVNAIRFAGRPPHPYMLNLCDRYGLFALVELPVFAAPGRILQEESNNELAAAMVREMIIRDRSHPSVFAWGIGEEFEVAHNGSRNFVLNLARIARRLDNRHIYYGTRFQENDLCQDVVDFVAVNPYLNDPKILKRELESWKRRNPTFPIFIGKLGREVQDGNKNGYSDPLSEEAQARFYIQSLEVLRALDADGVMLWSFNDWKGDRPSLIVNSGDEWTYSYGLVNGAREKRLAYDAVRSVLHGDKFAALRSGNKPADAPIVFVVTGLVILIGTAYLYNSGRRLRESINRSVFSSYNFFADVRDQRSISVLNSTVIGIIASIATAVVLASILHHFRNNWVFDNLLSIVIPFDDIKLFTIQIIRDPLRLILYASAGIFVLLLAAASMLMIIAPFFRMKVYPWHAYTTTMWATPPLLVFVPIGMIVSRAMESEMYVVPALILFVLVILWVVFRFFKAISIVFDVISLKVYGVAFVMLIGLAATSYIYLEQTHFVSAYAGQLYEVIRSSL